MRLLPIRTIGIQPFRPNDAHDNCPVAMKFIVVQNRFGESGAPNELIEHFGMGVKHIIEAVRRELMKKL